MKTSFRCIPAVLLLIPAAGPLLPGSALGAQQQTQDETIYLEEVKKDFLDRAKKCEDSRDWKGLFEHYQFAIRRYGQSGVQIGPDRWTRFGRVAWEPISSTASWTRLLMMRAFPAGIG